MKNAMPPNLVEAREQFKKHFTSRDYTEAEKQARYIAKASNRDIAGGWYRNAAACALYDLRFKDAISLATKALKLGDKDPNIESILSHAFGETGDFKRMKTYGRKILEREDARRLRSPITDRWKVCEVKSDRPSPETRERNIIAFSLFGNLPKYCEGAILNAKVAREVYPYWTPLFYVDDTVPIEVIATLESEGARVKVAGSSTTPKTMWRFEACDEPSIDRVIFRDADSLVNLREAHAVHEWVESSRCFHTMRDRGSHTALILAGMWGCAPAFLGGSSMAEAIARWLKTASGIDFTRFADQYFLSEVVWPLAREHLCAHDSVFEFGNTLNFSVTIDGRVGDNVSTSSITAHCKKTAFSKVKWHLRDETSETKLTCSYTTKANVDGSITVKLPANFMTPLQQGVISLRIEE